MCVNCWSEAQLRWRLREKAKAKATATRLASAKAKVTAQAGESKGCAGGEGTLGEEGLAGDTQYNMRAAYVYLGGWRILFLYVCEWSMWNMLPDIILCCEVEFVTYGQMAREVEQYNGADSAHGLQHKRIHAYEARARKRKCTCDS